MTSTTEYAAKRNAASTAVLDLLNQLLRDGYDDQALGDALLGYGLSIMDRNHGRQAVARHLYMLSLKFHDESQDPLPLAATTH